MNRSEEDKAITEQPWLKQAVNELQQPVAPSVAGQLRAARRSALHQSKAPKQSWAERLGFTGLFSPGMALAAGLGAVAVAVLLVAQPQTLAPEPVLQAKASGGNALLEDLPIIAAQDELQFYQDLELIEWLAQEGSLDAQG